MNCPVCNFDVYGRQIKLNSYRSQNENWVECLNCKSFYYLDEYNLETEINSNRTITNNLSWEEDNFNKKRYFNNSLIEILKELNPINKKLLDIGCSFGALLRIAKESDFEVYGYDIIPELKEVLEKYGIKNCINENIEKCDFNQLGVITVIDTNYLWKNQLLELKKLDNILSKNGILIIRTTSRIKLLKLGLFIKKISKKLSQKLIYKSILNHRFVCNYSEIERTLRKLNFEVLDISAYKSSLNSNFKNKIINKFFDFVYSISRKQFSLNALIIAIKK